MNPPDRHSIRRIVLPSGRAIEVVRFHDADAATTRGLHICPVCESDLVQPASWHETGEDHWELTLECPNCWWEIHDTYSRDDVDRLEEKLDDGLTQMLKDLQRLARANMVDEIDRFTAALEANLILPEDF